MTVFKLKYVDHFPDRHGKVRYYFRRPGGRRTPLPGPPGSKEFREAYEAALTDSPVKIDDRRQMEAYCFDWLKTRYFESMRYLTLGQRTQHVYRLAIERFIRKENIGHRLIQELRREHVDRMMAKRVKTPGAANDLLKKLRILIRFAIDNGWRKDDPTLRLKTFREGAFHSWTDEEIATYEAKWPVGSRERTAFDLLLNTGQRLSDVVKMSWRDIEGGAIKVVQGKTGVKLVIPLHPDLEASLSAWPKNQMVILTTSLGRPFSVKGFGNWMADRIERAGLPDRCVTHGLRKAAARQLAEAGCSASQIASITGHRTLKEVSRYTEAADQQQLAVSAIDRRVKQKSNKDSQT